MPETTITIDPDQRDGLYELARNHLGSIEDFWVALERTRDFDTAARLAREFEDDFRLLDDIGWRPDERGELFELTMPGQRLALLLRRLRQEAAEVLVEHGTEAQSAREDAERQQRLRVGRETCEKALGVLDPSPSETSDDGGDDATDPDGAAPAAVDATRTLVGELLRSSFALQDMLGALLEQLPDGTFPGEENGDVLIEMVVGSCLPATEAAGLPACRAATTLIAAVRDRVLDDLRSAAEAARRQKDGSEG
jgi:hypothetical protein